VYPGHLAPADRFEVEPDVHERWRPAGEDVGAGIAAAPHRRVLQKGDIAPFPHVADAAGHLGKVGAVLYMAAPLTGEIFRISHDRILVVVLQCCEESPVPVVAIDLRPVLPGDGALPCSVSVRCTPVRDN